MQLLKIARKVQKSGKLVTNEDIELAKLYGAIDEEIHDTVLIAAAFCMFNRYVDGLGTNPATKEEYTEMGRRMAKGYKMPPKFLKKFILKLMNRKQDSGAKENIKKKLLETKRLHAPLLSIGDNPQANDAICLLYTVPNIFN